MKLCHAISPKYEGRMTLCGVPAWKPADDPMQVSINLVPMLVAPESWKWFWTVMKGRCAGKAYRKCVKCDRAVTVAKP